MRRIKLLFLIVALLFLQGCSLNTARYINFEQSPSKSYYTEKIKENLKNNEDYTLQVFDTNLYKHFPVDKEDLGILKDFLSNLSDEAFLEEYAPKNKEKFRLIVNFSDEKYIIKIYDNKTSTITPWDGNYSEDIIDMSNLPTHFNLYDFCDYAQHKK